MSLGLVSYEYSSEEDNNDDEVRNSVEIVKKRNEIPYDIKNPSENINISEFVLTLPTPKKTTKFYEEDNDEFLKKKEIVTEKPPSMKKAPVRIMIPSLSTFKEDKTNDPKNQTVKINNKNVKTSGLLEILPKPKFDAIFNSTKKENNGKTTTPPNTFIPYSVTNSKKNNNNPNENKKPNEECNDEIDEEIKDFFSLNKQEKLPEINQNEITAMVAKKAAQFAVVSKKFSNSSKKVINKKNEIIMGTVEQISFERRNSISIDSEALTKLCGSHSKRKHVEELNIVDISQDQIISTDEWQRNSLAASTGYQPKGRLTDEEVIPGSKRKHQITYLAHQAKANEAELQAMWSAHRQTRRQTQSKYGF